MTVQVRVKRLNPDAKIPKIAKAGDVAFDLYSVIDYEIKPGERYAVPTGIALLLRYLSGMRGRYDHVVDLR